MRKFFVLVFLIKIFFITTLSYSTSEEFRSTAVVGFINLGNENEAYYNTMLTKSFITTLESIPGAKVILYPEIENVAIEQNFWGQKVFDEKIALKLGQKLFVKKIISGEYIKVKDELILNIFIYDVVTENLLFKKNYKISTSIEFFQNIESIGKDILGFIMGRDIDFGTLVFQITNASAQYILYINGKDTFSSSNEIFFKKQYLANEKIEILVEKNGKEVLRKSIILKPNEVFDIVYFPKGNLIVRNVGKKGGEFLFENTNYFLSNNERLFFKEIKVGNYEAIFKIGKNVEKKSFNIEEGETTVLTFGLPENYEYQRTLPLINILLPGLSQIQKKDYIAGAFFMVADLTALGFSALSLFAYNISSEKYERAVTENDKIKFSRLKSEWNQYLVFSVSAWTTITLSSVVHAFYIQNTEKSEPLSFYFLPEKDGITLNFTLTF